MALMIASTDATSLGSTATAQGSCQAVSCARNGVLHRTTNENVKTKLTLTQASPENVQKPIWRRPTRTQRAFVAADGRRSPMETKCYSGSNVRVHGCRTGSGGAPPGIDAAAP